MTIVDNETAGGQFVFGAPQIDRREGNTEQTFTVEVERLGNLSQPASVSWSVVAGGASADDFIGGGLPAFQRPGFLARVHEHRFDRDGASPFGARRKPG